MPPPGLRQSAVAFQNLRAPLIFHTVEFVFPFVMQIQGISKYDLLSHYDVHIMGNMESDCGPVYIRSCLLVSTCESV